MTEYNISSHGNNHYDNTDKEIYSAQRHVIYDGSNAENPPPLPPESLDEVLTGKPVWNLEKDRSNDDNIDFNYDDIDKEISQFKFEDSTGESETIVFYDCDDDLDATQQEERKYSIIESDNNDNNK